MASWNFFLTAQPASAVECVLGPVSVTQPHEEELVVVRGSALDVFRWEKDRLERVFGNVISETVACVLKAARSQSGCHLLVLITVSLQILVVRYDDDAKALLLLATADAGNMVVGATTQPAACCVSPNGWRLAVYLYSSIVAIVDLAGLEAAVETDTAMDLKANGKMFYVEVGEQVASLDFLPNSEDGDSLVALHAREDSCGAWEEGPKVLCIHSLDFQKKCSKARAKPDLSGRGATNAPGRRYFEASLIAAVPPNGDWEQGLVLAVGGGFVHLFDVNLEPLGAFPGTQAPTVLVKANSSGSRWLVGGSLGDLYLLQLEPSSVRVQCLGVSTPSSGIGVWGEGSYAFIGSKVGDSEVLRLREPRPDAPSTAATAAGRRRPFEDAFEVMDSWCNLGPITDFCTKELGLATQIITCSGSGDTGSLRFVQMGVPVEELGACEGFKDVLGVWALGSGLVLSRPGCTELLRAEGEDMCLKPRTSGLPPEQTLLCCSFDEVAIQVTRSGVCALSLEQLQVTSKWTPEEPILTAAACRKGVLVAAASGKVHAVGQSEGALLRAASWQLAGEPSCLAASRDLCAAGLWSDELCIWQREEQGDLETLQLPALPRSAVFLRTQAQLFVGLCDGRVLCTVQAGAWQIQRSVSVGLQPVKLLLLESQTEIGPKLPGVEESEPSEMVLAMSGQGSILQVQSKRIIHSQVCLPSMSYAAFFSHGFAGIDCMAFISGERLILGRLRCDQKMHCRTVELPQPPRRIGYHSSGICVVGCCDPAMTSTPIPSRSRALLQFVDSETTHLLDSMTLSQDEMVASVVAVTFAQDYTEYVAVGTAVVVESEPEPSRGQVRILAPSSAGSSGETLKPFQLFTTLEVMGAVYALVPFQGRLLGAVNNRLQLWDLKGAKLSEVCRYSTGVIVLDIQIIGDLILVGDIMRSVNLFRFNSEDLTLEMVAFDEISAWSTAVGALSDNHFLCADDCGKLLALRCGQKLQKDGSDILERVAHIHTGEFMNRFRAGSLGVRFKKPVKAAIWASASGAFGMVAAVEEQRFKRLLRLQELLSSRHSTLNARPEEREDEGFLNGNVLQGFLDMSEEQQQALASQLGEQVPQLLELLEDIQSQ